MIHDIIHDVDVVVVVKKIYMVVFEREFEHGRTDLCVIYIYALFSRNALSGVLDTRQVSVSRLSNVLKLDR
jgi:hypothetical protein